MRPVKITIEGDYVDCQIYRGRLYLWTLDGALQIYNWNAIVEYLTKTDTDKIAMTFCFVDGNYLYKSSIIELFKDTDFKNLLEKKFERVNKKSLHITKTKLKGFLIGRQDTPTKNIPTDTEIYSNKLYFITDSGLYATGAHRNLNQKYLVSSKPKKLWDCNLLSIKANKYPQLALSGGSEGLFELDMIRKVEPENLKSVEIDSSIYKISDEHSSFSNYSFLSIYNSSTVDKSFMALFGWQKKQDFNQKDFFQREYEQKVSENSIFQSTTNINSNNNLSWGVDDKIYRATELGFEIVKFNNYAKKERGENLFTPIKHINLQAWKGKVINGGTAYFGTIVECENALVVLLSNGENLTIDGPITRWRVYPRSINYENHLHVILDDKIEIYSFNQDYFLNQKDKYIGLEYKAPLIKKQQNTSDNYFGSFGIS